MNSLIEKFQARHIKKSIPAIHPGDVVRIHEKITEGKKERIQIFEGIITSIHKKKDLDATFTVRKISFGVGVEKTFPMHMPNIIKIETIRGIKARRAKLYYIESLTAKQLKKKKELKDYVLWEDNSAKEEEEELKAQKEAEAKAKEEEKKKEQEELDKKFAETRGEEVKTEPTAEEKK